MKVYNSLARQKKELLPIQKGRIGMYVCGPTVYDEPHIGHARSAYIFDTIRRYLEYKGFEVTFVRNVTDVDDKIIEKARQAIDHRSKTADLKERVKDISKQYLDAYHEDMDLLGIGRPDKEPRATEYIPKMIKFIETLIKRECAYVADGDVYFDIKKAEGYGKLSNQSLEKMEVGARIMPVEKKRDGLDFVLWKSSKEDEPSWKSPWSFGRPGWHIECSVMSSDILGDEFDIHGGGIDLIFPHHENEIAQSGGAGKAFARAWLHNGLLTIKGEKMAKSLGNFISIKYFLSKHKDPDYLKLFFLSAHYRSPIDYAEDRIEEAKKGKERFRILIEKIDRIIKVKTTPQKSLARQADEPGRAKLKDVDDFKEKFEKAMDDDFNTPLALASLFDLVSFANRFIQEKDSYAKKDLEKIKNIKSLLLELSSIFGLSLSKEVIEAKIDEKEIKKLVGQRGEARRKGDFKAADAIRKRLSDKGVILEDAKTGTTWRRRI